MIITPICTRRLMPPRDHLFDALRPALSHVSEKSIFVVSSKAVSIGEGRCIPKTSVSDLSSLVKQEADWFLPLSQTPHRTIPLTVVRHAFIGKSGIDESNGNGYLILLPKDPTQSARMIRSWIQREYHVSDVGVIIADSYSMMLRRGASVISIGTAGFAPLIDYRKTPDLFGRPFVSEVENIADKLAAAGGAVMGEGALSAPVVCISDLPERISFSESEEGLVHLLSFSEDRFSAILKQPWEQGGKK